VRSSATAEDLPDLSFAGQQETFLNICGPERVVDAVRACWASLWTARAIAYRMRVGIQPEAVALAVVIQQLVAAEAAGILFTANPLNNRRDEYLINAAWGLGEAIVGGAVTPDEVIVEAATGRVKQLTVADKALMTVRTEVGTREMPVPDDRRRLPVLTGEHVAELAQLGRTVAALSGAPQDIEWCLSGGTLSLLQARPITTLYPQPTPQPKPADGLRVYLGLNVALQSLSEPLTPMGTEFFRLLYVGMMDTLAGRRTDEHPGWLTQAAERLYLDVTDLLADQRLGPFIAARIDIKDPVAGGVFRHLLVSETGHLGSGRRIRWPWRLLAPVAPRLLGPALISYLAPGAARERAVTFGERRYQSLVARHQTPTGHEDRLRFVEDSIRAHFWPLFYQVAYCTAGLRGVDLIPQLLRRWLGRSDLVDPVLQALPHNPTTEMGQALLDVAITLQREGAAASAEHAAVRAFLARYGHRAVREIDVGLPRWWEDPGYVLEMLDSYIRQPDLAERRRAFDRAHVQAEAAIPRIVAEVRRHKGPVYAALMAHLLRCLRETGGLREQPKFDLVRGVALLRQVLLTVGQDLVAHGRLTRSDDVFYLTFAQIRSADDLRPLAAEARQRYQREVARAVVPHVITSTGECFYTAPDQIDDPSALTGSPVSPGVYEGIARVVATPHGAELARGEILVTRSTDPSWTPLFLNAGAVVMETGGPISHGAIVAREYGIPAVASVCGATRRLHTGQRLRVDGSQGRVVIL
jgi:pyruvate,water dikinase